MFSFTQYHFVETRGFRMEKVVSERSISLGHRLANTIAAQAGSVPIGEDFFFYELVNTLPAAIYTTDAAGRITYFNKAAESLWGCRPELGRSEWCGSWKLFWPNGQSMSHDECPMAIAIREKRPVRGLEAIAERPDGTRVPFIPFPTPIYNVEGQFIGAVNLLVDISDRKHAEEAMYHLAAIIETSEDAIISKNLSGIITSWNKSAERIFGYLAEEIIGKSVKTLIPPELQNEEDTILDRLRRGERIDHYETVRQRKHGSKIDVSLSISPIKDHSGNIIGASKIARDITEQKRIERQVALLGREAEHRTKNVLATVQAVVRLTRASSSDEFKKSIEGRIQALANVNSLFVQSRWSGAELKTLIANELSAYSQGSEPRFEITGPDLILETDAAQIVAIALHELTTNAAKYGALSVVDGFIKVECLQSKGQLVIRWTESGGPPAVVPKRTGFGSRVIEKMIQEQLKGRVQFTWRKSGLCCDLVLNNDFHTI